MKRFSLVSIFALHSAEACSTMAAGKKATVDGSVIVTHSDDGAPGMDTRLIYVPPADHAPGAMRPIYYDKEDFPRFVSADFGPGYLPNADVGPKLSEKIGEIPQVAHTYGYQDTSYGVINEHNVGIGESTCSGMFKTCAAGTTIGCEKGRDVGVALMSIDTLSKIAMERTKTAREAVQLIGDLAFQYGFYGTLDFEGPAESLQIGDAEEAFTLNILADPTGTSAIWAARRVPDENVTVLTNMFTLREMDPNDNFNYLFSPNIFSVAEEHGFWKPGEAFDFTKIYSNGEYAHKYYAGRRMWGAFRLIAPSVKLSAEYDDLRYDRHMPWSMKPDKLMSHHDFISIHRDWYAGTPYDTTKGLAAGYGGSPDRFRTSSDAVKGNWERTIALYRSDATFVVQLRKPSATVPKEVAGVVWFGPGAAHYSPFIPIPSGVTRSITPLTNAVPTTYNPESLNWATRKIGDVCQIRFDAMHPTVEKVQQMLEDHGEKLVAASVSSIGTPDFNAQYEAFAVQVTDAWRKLAGQLLFSYDSNTNIIANQALGYPDDWLRGVGYQQGPPPPPVEEQCPPKCPAAGAGATVVV